jgi:hypothetical protein
MSKQNPRNQIDKASLSFLDSIKDTVNANIMTASRSIVKLEPNDLAKLMTIINASVEEGFHRAARVFSKSVDVAIAAAEDDSWKQGNADSGSPTFPSLTTKSKKKHD